MLDSGAPVFPVRITLRRTGLTAELLRAWERRYGVVSPARTQGGQRLYSEADIVRLSLLRRGTLHGHSIGRIAELSDPELEQLLADVPVATAGQADQPVDSTGAATVRACLDAIQWMDGAALDGALRRAAVSLGLAGFSEQVVAPLIKQVAELRQGGRLRIVQEHFATSTVRQVLTGLHAFAPAKDEAPVFVAATTTGQRHEIGAILSAAIATAYGWRAIYLGPDLPGEEIGIAAARLHAGAIALSIANPNDEAPISTDLNDLSEAVGKTIPVYVGGEGARRHAARIEACGFQLVPTLTDLRERLGRH